MPVYKRNTLPPGFRNKLYSSFACCVIQKGRKCIGSKARIMMNNLLFKLIIVSNMNISIFQKGNKTVQGISLVKTYS